MPVTLDRREGPYGEVVLRQRDDHFEIIANGTFLMDTSDGRSERLLVDAALQALKGRGDRRAGGTRARTADAGDSRTARADAPGTGHAGDARATDANADADAPTDAGDGRRPSVLIGGLGVGFSLAHAAADPSWGRIAVVEREQAIIDWHRAGPLAALSGSALADPRTTLIHADLVAYVHDPDVADTYDALCLDIDNGPDWTVTEGNDSLYSPAGLAACARRLNSGGVLAVWSARPSADFEESLRNAGFTGVRTEEIPVARGVPDVVHLGVRPA
ncbi:spermidine synthase [Streptomyces sp. enrichment culture]|uniref:spermidine synthase n=1 Tax=Streptomyces sp. enrichment culture TaxID=1795815 RepID=UPI003F54B022